MTDALSIPDPQQQPVPRGWWETSLIPAASELSWSELDEVEARLLGFAAAYEALGGDVTELEKGMRFLEKRRGDLLGPAEHGGDRRSSDFQASDATLEKISEPMKRRYRMIARWWDELLYPYLIKSEKRSDVRQSALLRYIARHKSKSALNVLTRNATQGQFERLHDVLVIDPPWPVEKIERDVREFQSSDLDYPILSVPEIRSLTLPIAADAHVWLWTTQRFLPHAFRVLRSWKLKYVCTHTWHKAGGFQPLGLPQYNSEFVLYARKGSPTFTSTKGLKTCFRGKRGKHSEKPDEFYEMVRNSTSGERDAAGIWNRIDMFNRRAIDGFEPWGFEAHELEG